MDKSPETTLEQDANICRKQSALVEPQLQTYREELKRLPKAHPVAVFIEAYLAGWEAISRGELTQALAEEITELRKILESAGALQPKPDVDADKVDDDLGRAVNESGFDYPATKRIMTIATQPERGAPRADTAMEALVMKVVGKSFREIADALCGINHTHDERCQDRFRKEIKKLSVLYEKYKPRN